jgi:hypothetical protein
MYVGKKLILGKIAVFQFTDTKTGEKERKP